MLLSATGPYNPAAAISIKTSKKVLYLEFVEMAEISADDDLQAAGRPSSSARPPIVNISQWLEQYAVMAAILTTRFPEKTPELFAYQHQLCMPREIMRTSNGWLTTGSTGGRPSPGRT